MNDPDDPCKHARTSVKGLVPMLSGDILFDMRIRIRNQSGMNQSRCVALR